MNLLEIIRSDNKKILIHTSTSEVFGSAKYTPMDEKHPIQAQSPYSASKIAADHACMSYYNSYNSSVVILRPFNTYGPRQSNRAIIPTIINQMIAGNSLRLGNLKIKRDFTFVEDTCLGIESIFSSKKCFGEIVNIGSNKNLTNIEICKNLLKHSKQIINIGNNVKIKFVKDRPGHDFRYALNSNKLRKKLNWKPKTTFEKGIKLTIKWYKDNKDYYKTIEKKDIQRRLGI